MYVWKKPSIFRGSYYLKFQASSGDLESYPLQIRRDCCILSYCHGITLLNMFLSLSLKLFLHILPLVKCKTFLLSRSSDLQRIRLLIKSWASLG